METVERVENVNLRRQIWSCGCGLKYTHSNKKKHERTERHQIYESKKGFIDIDSFKIKQ